MRKLLGRRVSVGAMIELGLWLLIPYLVIGLVWLFLHPAGLNRLQEQWDRMLPAGSQVIALVEMTTAWPLLALGVHTCVLPGS